jgi:predicted MPP superfamily phosphohydrolase
MASVEGYATASGRPNALLERARLAFFRSFFRLLIVFIAVAEWACIAWTLRAFGIGVPRVLHLVAPLAIFALNRGIVLSRRAGRAPARPAVQALLRAYVAFAFTSVFAGLFLAAAGLVWTASLLLVPVVPAGMVAPLADAYRWVVHAGLAGIGTLFFFGYIVGPRALTTTGLRVAIPDLPAPFDGFRIVHLSDIHIGPYLDREELAAHVERVNALAPDLICITGDLVDRPETCAEGFPVLAGLRARHGVLVTLGNHDFYAGADTVTAALRRLTDFTVLRNAPAEVRVGDAVVSVLGIDDLGRDWARGVLEHPALPGLAEDVPDGRAVILLSHRPDCFAQAARLGVSLVLSGHTHGGQLALPSWLGGRATNLAQFITDFDRGLYRVAGATLYVNRGLGFTGQKIRLFTPREIACIELTRA